MILVSIDHQFGYVTSMSNAANFLLGQCWYLENIIELDFVITKCSLTLTSQSIENIMHYDIKQGKPISQAEIIMTVPNMGSSLHFEPKYMNLQ